MEIKKRMMVEECEKKKLRNAWTSKEQKGQVREREVFLKKVKEKKEKDLCIKTESPE